MSEKDDHWLNWSVLQKEPDQDYVIFRTRRHKSRHNASEREGLFSIVDAPNWVNVVAITEDENVVMVRQYRHGIDAVTLEIPGGMVDPGEDMLNAAQRELREETGFVSDHWVDLGSVHPNPAFMTNQCGLFLATQARCTRALELDANEVLEVVAHPLLKVPALIMAGEISHTLVISAFFRIQQLYPEWTMASGTPRTADRRALTV